MATSTSSIGSTGKRMRVTSVVTLATPSMNTKIVYSTLRSSLRCASPSLSLWSSILALTPPAQPSIPKKIHPQFFFSFPPFSRRGPQGDSQKKVTPRERADEGVGERSWSVRDGRGDPNQLGNERGGGERSTTRTGDG